MGYVNSTVGQKDLGAILGPGNFAPPHLQSLPQLKEELKKKARQLKWGADRQQMREDLSWELLHNGTGGVLAAGERSARSSYSRL